MKVESRKVVPVVGRRMSNVATIPPRYLLWLNWPISAFRLDARSLAVFKECVTAAKTAVFPVCSAAKMAAPHMESRRPGGDVITVVRSERAFLKALPSATHAIVWEFKKEWFARAKNLRVLATPSAGRELLPTDAEMPPGIVRVNGAFHGQIMSETVVACLFAHARGLYRAYDFQREGAIWPRAALSPFCSLVAGTKAVILGYGKIGHTVGAKLEALGVSVVGIRRANIADLKPALKTADWLIVVLPSDTGTDNIVDASVLRSMKRSAVIVNIGRGNAVDEEALAAALRARRIAAAYLDVFKREPLTKASPLAADIPGLVRLPHASAFAPDYLPLFFRELQKGGWLA